MTAAARARDQLVDALRATGRLHTPAVEAAFRAVPRHFFLPDLPVGAAYADEAVAVQHVDGVPTSSASQPSMMAIMLEQLDVRAGHRVLEIGAGTGYNAGLLAHLTGPGGAVTAVDIDPGLVEGAAAHLGAAGIAGVEVVCGDGARGHPPGAPYDRIVLTVGSPDVRPEWVAQLAPGGRLLLPLALRGSQLCVALDLEPDGVLRSRSVRGCAFVRLRGIGAGGEAPSPLPGTPWMVQAAGTPVEPARLADALAAPSSGPLPVPPRPERLGSADLWDGFGLFLALTCPGTARLLLADPDAPTGAIRPVAPGIGTPVLTGPDGFAALVAGSPDHVEIAGFSAGGAAEAVRLGDALAAWNAAGRPTAATLELAVRPRADPAPPEPGRVQVLTEHCRITVGWPAAVTGP